ncbi:MAG: hypothetical protein IT406_01710 [Candidatus Yanofskybacteria bacterium]|nr:hypothetical protein [Candidatus Yanofskybacteria bacterium]
MELAGVGRLGVSAPQESSAVVAAGEASRVVRAARLPAALAALREEFLELEVWVPAREEALRPAAVRPFWVVLVSGRALVPEPPAAVLAPAHGSGDSSERLIALVLADSTPDLLPAEPRGH